MLKPASLAMSPQNVAEPDHAFQVAKICPIHDGEKPPISQAPQSFFQGMVRMQMGQGFAGQQTSQGCALSSAKVREADWLQGLTQLMQHKVLTNCLKS